MTGVIIQHAKTVTSPSTGGDPSVIYGTDWNNTLSITPGTIASILSDHNKATHDALGIVSTSYAATSSTSLTIGTGSKSFTTQTGLSYLAGNRARAASNAGPTNYMEGIVTSYSGTTLVISVDLIGGSGTKTDWNIGIAGDVGSTGATGAQGIQGNKDDPGSQGIQGNKGDPGSDASVTRTNINSALYGTIYFSAPTYDSYTCGLVPVTDNTYKSGAYGQRWSALYAAVVYQGDSAFTEKTCPKCNQSFVPGDALALMVKTVTDQATYTIPMHLKCKDKPKVKISVSIPVEEIEFQLINGKIQPIKVHKEELVTEQVTRLKRKVELINDKQITHTAIVDKKTGQCNLKGVIISQEDALEIITETRRLTKWKDIEIEI